MSNTEHAVHVTPSVGWVLEKMAGRTAKPLTPYGAWLKLRGPFVDALDAAEKSPAMDWAPGGTAAYEAARETVNAAKAALREFDRKNPKPHTTKTWKEVERVGGAAERALLEAIFGGGK